MAINGTFFIIAILVVAIWVIIEIKRLKHKLLAIFLIGVILFGYFSFTMSLKGQNVDLKSIPGVISAGKIYFAWMGSAFHNLKSITAYASKQNWKDTNVSNNETNESNSINTIKEEIEKTNITETVKENVTSTVQNIWDKL